MSGEGFDRRLGALLGTFVEDALGMPFGRPAAQRARAARAAPGRLGRGTYTDDTEMVIALAGVLAEAGECEEERLAERFLERHNPAPGRKRRSDACRSSRRRLRRRRGPPSSGGHQERANRSRHPLGVAGAVAQAAAVGAAVRGDEPLETAIRVTVETALREALDRAAAAVLADVAGRVERRG